MGGLCTALAKLKTGQHQKCRYVPTCLLIVGYCKQIGLQFRFKSFQWDVRSFKFYRQRVQSSVGPCELSVFEEQQDFHAWPIVDAGSHYRQVKSCQQCMKEQHHVGTCRREHQVCTGFVDGLKDSATDRVDRL